MSRDLALRGAIIGLLAAGGGAVAGDLSSTSDSGITWALAIIAAGVAGGMAAWLALRVPARAVREVAEASARLAEGELDQRVQVVGGPANELTHGFNVMTGRVQELFDAVAAEHARLEAVFDASTDGMVALAADATVRFLNPAAVELFATSMTDAVGRPFIHSARDFELDALVRRVAISSEGETSVISFGPNRTPLRAAALPIRNGGDWAVLLMLTDLTEVNRVDQVRRDFLGNVSHELRTPLASIRALVETLEDGGAETPEETAEFMRRIRQQVDRLTSLVIELLDLSRIESGAIELVPESIDLSNLIAEAASLLQTRAESQGVTIECPATDGLSIEGDRTSLLRVASNLLDNAIKYSPRGGRIHAQTVDEGELAALSVRDEGPGIAEQDLPRVFERFYKGEASRSTSGTGLGLAIVKHIVRAHGGTVTAANAPEGGAVFTVRLPRAFVGAKPAQQR
ncbi:MAG: hypothetical protein C0506_12750 [Anaerolinea sp.]|nr:hypothetical protein [Anaerolinea sp.]